MISKIKRTKEKYEISQAKEELELKIAELRIDEENKGEDLHIKDLSKINSEKIDVGSTEKFPVEIIYDIYKFQIDENYNVIYIGKIDSTRITYITEPKGYTNQDKIKILIIAKNEKGIKSIKYPGGDVLKCNGKKQVGIDYEVTKNGIYKFNIIDIENKEIEKDIVIDQIDKLPPLDFIPTAKRNGKSIIITENAQDAEADDMSTKSGIDYYEYYLIDENNETKKYDTNRIEERIEAYKLYVIAYDKAGNYKKSDMINVEKYTLKKPEIICNTKEWTNKNVIVEVDYGNTGESYIKEVSIDGGNTYFEYTGPIEIEKNTLVKARIRDDSAYEESEFKIENIDKLPPNDFTPEIEDNLSFTELKINAHTTDKEKDIEYECSGINKYKYYVYKNNYLITSSELILENNWIASNLTVGETYNIYVEVYDNAGNITKSSTIDYQKLEIYRWQRYSVNEVKAYSIVSREFTNKKLSGIYKYPRYYYEDFDNLNGIWKMRSRTDTISLKDSSYRYIDYNKHLGFSSLSNPLETNLIGYIVSVKTENSYGYISGRDYYSQLTTIYTRGDTLYDTVTSNLPDTYPEDYYQEGYWYIKEKMV